MDNLPNQQKNEIVVYQPDETIRLDVRLENETVWLTQSQLCDLFSVVKSNISYHLKNIFDSGELAYEATVQKIRTVQEEGGRRSRLVREEARGREGDDFHIGAF